MTSRNDITGDEIKTKTSSDKYRDGWDKIFGKKKEDPKPSQDSEQKVSSRKKK